MRILEELIEIWPNEVCDRERGQRTKATEAGRRRKGI